MLENGGTISQETRRWDDLKNCNFLLRSKEDAQDYRYFPEPDLATILLDEEHLKKLKDSIPELPNKKTVRFMRDMGLPEEDARQLVESIEKAAYFEEIVAAGQGKIVPKDAANWVLGSISRVINETGKSIAEIGIAAADLAN